MVFFQCKQMKYIRKTFAMETAKSDKNHIMCWFLFIRFIRPTMKIFQATAELRKIADQSGFDLVTFD